ncbi:MAG: YitT family protein [Tumebacillaceae bacterium]
MRIVWELFLILIGCAITAFGINVLIVPAGLMTGGLTGICVILYHFFGWPVGTQYFIYNVPLVLLGYKYIGKKFIFYTIYGVVLLSLFLNIIHLNKTWTTDPLLSSIFGDIIMSVGAAIVLRFGGSTGGLDILGRVIARYRDVPMGRFNMVINSAIVVASAGLFEVQTAMYTLISIFAGSKTYEALLNHVDRISMIVVTEKGEEVAQAITRSMLRGVTMWNAHGAYTQQEKQVLLCVIVNVQLPELKKVIVKTDDKAFISIVPTKSIVGNFHQVW